ncbi:MAG TPA: Gldg family protein [Longimicrobiales bacterium]
MRQTWTLARREFRSYFDHPTAYILVVAFLALGLFLAFRTLLAAGTGTLRSLFSLLPWLFCVFIPAITMRSFAEERRSGTFEWLLAQPVRELDLVAGKFLGNWLFALVALAGTIPAGLGVLLFSEADAGIMVAQYIGAALLTAQMVAIGLFASSATRNQITAFILAAAVSFGLVLIGLEVVLIGLPASLSGPVSRLSLLGHFENIARGVLDLRDVLYFLSTTGLFLALAYLLLAGERLSALRGGLRRLRAGAAGIAVGVLVLNLLGAHIRGRLDLTADRLYTLSDGTEQVLEGLDDVVTVKLVASTELPAEIGIVLRDVRDLLADYRSASDGRVHVVELHPDEDEEAADEAASLGIQSIQFNVLRDDEFEIKQGWLGLAVLYADEREVIPMISRTDDLEYRLTSMISSMTAESKPRLAFLTGFGARGPGQYPALREALSARYAVESVNLEQDSAVALPADSFDVVVLAGPDRRLDAQALDALDGYLDAGGAALVLADGNAVDPRMPFSRPVETGLDSLLADRGVRLASGLVYDLRSNERVSLGRRGIFNVIAPYPFWPVVLPAGEHVMTRGLESLTLGWASGFEVTDSARVHPVWTTTEFGGLRAAGGPIMPDAEFAPDPATLAPQVVAAVVEGVDAASGDEAEEAGDEAAAEESDATEAEGAAERAGGRMVVVGDADFLADEFVRSNPQNLVFAANAIDWLAQDEALIAIRSKDRTPPPLVFDSEFQKAALKWGNLIGVPLLFIIAGAARVANRRRLSGRSWEEEMAA